MDYENTQPTSIATPNRHVDSVTIVDTDLVVVGGNIGCLVAALEASERGFRVRLILPERGVGSGFSSIQHNDCTLDVGCRRFDLTSETQQSPLADYRPGVRTRPFAHHYRRFLEKTLGMRLVRTPTPQASFCGRLVPDFVTSLDLTCLKDLLSDADVAHIISETDAILTSKTRSPLTLGLGTWPDLSSATLEEASLANHGPTFHARIIEPFAQKLYPLRWKNMPAELASKIWAPLFFPRTINHACQGKIDRDRSGITYFYPESGHFGEMVTQLLAKIDASPLVQTMSSSGFSSLDRDGKYVVATQESGPTLRWSGPFALGTSADQYCSFSGASSPLDKLSLGLHWIELKETDLVCLPEMINVFDDDTPVYRISLGGICSTAGSRLVTLETTGGPLEFDASSAGKILQGLGVLRQGAEVRVVRQEQNIKIVAPSFDNRTKIDCATKSLNQKGIHPILMGTLNGMNADTLADNVLQGLQVGDSLQPVVRPSQPFTSGKRGKNPIRLATVPPIHITPGIAPGRKPL